MPDKGSVADQLDRVTPAFDALVADARVGHPLPPARYHELEARAQAIATAIVASFRGPANGARPVNPPLRERNGQAWW